MKNQKISESGLIGNDGLLRMPMDRVNAWFKDHKGERVVVCFEAVEIGSTEAQQRYYYGYVLPTLVDAYKENGTIVRPDILDNELILSYPGYKGFNNEYIGHARYLSKSQMSEFLEWLKQFAAENLSVYIEDPRTI